MQTIAHNKPAWAGETVVDANLVLEGGAMRGQFTAGVLDCLMEKKLVCKRVIGVSMGALTGWYYVAGMHGQAAYQNIRYCEDWRYFSMKSFRLTGNACGREFVFDKVPNVLEKTDRSWFDESPSTLISVASNLETGEADYHEHTCANRKEVSYLIASSAMPLVSKIVEVDNKKLLDGGAVDSVPILYSKLTGAPKHIVITTNDASYVRKPEKLMPLLRRTYSDYPYYLDRLRYRFFEYNRTYRALKRMHEDGSAFVIMPPEPVTIADMEKDPAKLLALYEQGYETALRQWPALEAYLTV